MSDIALMALLGWIIAREVKATRRRNEIRRLEAIYALPCHQS